MWENHDLSKMQERKNSNGYMEVWYPEHPNNVEGWVLKHRLVMENHIERYLDPLDVVHHVNEIKTCNEIWNLWLTNEKEHTFIHRLGKHHTRSATARMSKKHRKIAQTRQRDPYGRFITGGEKKIRKDVQ